MSAPTFLEMSPARRAYCVEDYREILRSSLSERGVRPTEDLPLSRVTTAWLRRLQTALVDADSTVKSIRQMDRAACAAVPAEELDELGRRVTEFALVASVFPLDAHSAEEALPAIHAEMPRLLLEPKERSIAGVFRSSTLAST